MAKCSCKNCYLEVFENRDKCILHCEKNDFEVMSLNYEFFKKELKKYVLIEYEDNEKFYLFRNLVFPAMNVAQNRYKKSNPNYIFNGYEEKTDMLFIECIFTNKTILQELEKQKEIIFKKCIFNKLEIQHQKVLNYVIFEECIFLDNVNIHDVSLNDTVSFDGSKFHKTLNMSYIISNNIISFANTDINKLNLEHVTFKITPNFLNINVKKLNRETARIIKDSFEQQNNIIEANKFYALEMKEREKELDEDRKKGKNIFEWFVFKVHGLASNHSQDWLLALIWICIFGLIGGIYQFYFLETAHKVLNEKTLDFALGSAIFLSVCLYIYFMLYGVKKYSLYLVIGSLLVAVYLYLTKDYTFTYFSKSINPFSMMNGNEDINLIELLFKVVFSYLIYQLIISIRQNTRRK